MRLELCSHCIIKGKENLQEKRESYCKDRHYCQDDTCYKGRSWGAVGPETGGPGQAERNSGQAPPGTAELSPAFEPKVPPPRPHRAENPETSCTNLWFTDGETEAQRRDRTVNTTR